jgi:HSP20 family protein
LHDRPAVAAGIDYGKIDWIPWLDVFENERSFVVRVELPGIDPQKMDVHLAGRRLVIAGSKEEAREDRRAHYWRAERRFGTFRRTVFLPESVDPQRVTAEYADGVLVVRCEKKGIAVPRRVPVQLAHAA